MQPSCEYNAKESNSNFLPVQRTFVEIWELHRSPNLYNDKFDVLSILHENRRGRFEIVSIYLLCPHCLKNRKGKVGLQVLKVHIEFKFQKIRQ